MGQVQDLMREAVGGAVAELQAAREQAQQLTAAAMVERYVREHQGRPDAVRAFVGQHVDPGDVAREAQLYVEAMERRLRGGQRGGAA